MSGKRNSRPKSCASLNARCCSIMWMRAGWSISTRSMSSKKGIGLRAYGQQDPVVAFRLESFDMFDEMTASIREGTVRIMLTVPVRSEEDVRREQQAKITSTSGASDGSDKARPVRKDKKPGPNDPCYCGSGKKYKKVPHAGRSGRSGKGRRGKPRKVSAHCDLPLRINGIWKNLYRWLYHRYRFFYKSYDCSDL